MKIFKNNSISRKISLTVIGVLCVTLTLYLVIFFVQNDSKVKETIEEENKQLTVIIITILILFLLFT